MSERPTRRFTNGRGEGVEGDGTSGRSLTSWTHRDATPGRAPSTDAQPVSEPTVYLQDPDVTLHHGDVLDTLRAMSDGSVDCVVTSPPYWGLRDYGTGAWEGGDPDCDHTGRKLTGDLTEPNESGEKFRNSSRYSHQDEAATATVCGKCGATRTDQQLGLEPTPDLFVARMVEVFREVRRVLAAHGTCWVNLGDSYASQGGPQVPQTKQHTGSGYHGTNRNLPGLKPKDLVGIPWRVAFALQADGWYLRSDIVWSKPNPMPESVTDRPTKAHEYVFLLTKQSRYWFDQEAVREPLRPASPVWGEAKSNWPGWSGNPNVNGEKGHAVPANPAGRNIRSVWEIATQPYPEAHFATYPEELVRRCLLAGCPEWVCRECGKPRERIVETTRTLEAGRKELGLGYKTTEIGPVPGVTTLHHDIDRQTLGWSDCGHNNYRPGLVLDPFVGSGTTAHVARKHGRHAIGIDLSADYLALAARRLQQQSLFADVAL